MNDRRAARGELAQRHHDHDHRRASGGAVADGGPAHDGKDEDDERLPSDGRRVSAEASARCERAESRGHHDAAEEQTKGCDEIHVGSAGLTQLADSFR